MDHIKNPKVDNVKLIDRFSTRHIAVGTLYLTATHLFFMDNDGSKEIWILHMHLSNVEKLPMTTGGAPLRLHCKNFMCITFVIPKERECLDVFMSLLELSKPQNIESLYAFSYQSMNEFPKSFGWDLFDTQTEYMRMGAPNENWVVSAINEDYKICDTYPRYIFVPAVASSPVLLGSSKFRSRGRLPVLSYLHLQNQATICRCSQPLAGFSARCLEDEQMLYAILKANPKSDFMYVVDTRPKINAMANKAAGKGYENESFYSNIKFQFCGIENIHIMRTSLQKLIDVCELKTASVSTFLSGLMSSGWLKHIQSILETSVFIAKAVYAGTSVLVHCSDGWDRTAQTCSLSSLMLDHFYRTFEGFMALIEKEWISFGHKFMDRCGFLSSVDSKETSPVFTQFLDSVWQMMHQFPCAFQFNERFLLTLHDHVYSCQFGTFLGNCEKDRVENKWREQTVSLWGYLSFHKSEYLNPLFKKEYEVMHPVLIPKTYPQCIKFWKGMYNRFETGIHPRDQIQDILAAAKDHSSSLEDHVQLLEKRLTQICQVLGKSDDLIHRALQGGAALESLDAAVADDAGHSLLRNGLAEMIPSNKLNDNLRIESQSDIDNQSDFDGKRDSQCKFDDKRDNQANFDSKLYYQSDFCGKKDDQTDFDDERDNQSDPDCKRDNEPVFDSKLYYQSGFNTERDDQTDFESCDIKLYQQSDFGGKIDDQSGVDGKRDNQTDFESCDIKLYQQSDFGGKIDDQSGVDGKRDNQTDFDGKRDNQTDFDVKKDDQLDFDVERDDQLDSDIKKDDQSDFDGKRHILECSQSIDGNISQTKSDSESGFDESCSQMSRSGIEECATFDTEPTSGSASIDKLNVDQLHLELDSVAVVWKSFRNISTCSCAMPFDHFTKKFHCWRCGEVFCTRCIARNIPLPGHCSRRPVPVCKQCYKKIRHLPSSMEFNLVINHTMI